MSGAAEFAYTHQAYCSLIDPTDGKNTDMGYIWLHQEGKDKPVTYFGMVKNIDQGKHGFHTHEKGVITDACTDLGGHFNLNA